MSASTNSPISRLCGIAVPRSETQKKSKELALSQATAAQNQGDIQHAVFAARSVLWDNGQVLDYSFFGGTPKQQAKVDEVIQEWTWYANITFKKSTPRNSNATLRITFDPSKGSWSYVGNSAKTCVGPAPTINLGWIGDSDTTTKKERGVILHEFGHVLGLMHEHESPARSGVIRLKEKEIIQYYSRTQNWDEATVRKQVLDVYSKESVSNYSQFDPTSIMMYFMPGSMNEGGVDIHEVTELSMLDKAFVAVNYPRTQSHPRALQWTPGFALIAAGANSDTIAAYNATTDIDEKRGIFTKDMVDLRLFEAKRSKSSDKPGIQHAPLIQRGAETELDDNQLIEDVLKQLDLLDPQSAVQQPDSIQHALEVTAHAEMVQKGVLGLLLEIAPMILLAPNIPAPGSSDVAHAVLDPNHLTLDHPVVQFGLSTFFTKLASNDIVKQAMSGAVKLAGNLASEALTGLLPQHGAHSGPQHGLTDQMARLASLIATHPSFKIAVDAAVATATENLTNRVVDRVLDGASERELEYRRRMDEAVKRMWEKGGPQASERVLEKLEHLWEKSE